MDFTREPIIETIITPKEGCKLVVRSTKNTGQEEYLVDAVEVVSFGQAFFFRSLERPKAFLAPVSDFEVLEVKEARMVLKNVTQDRSIKIGGGRDGQIKGSTKEIEKSSHAIQEESKSEPDTAKESEKTEGDAASEIRLDKKRDRRRNYRKKRGNENAETSVTEEKIQEGSSPSVEEQQNAPSENEGEQISSMERTSTLPLSVLSSLLQPPPTLISETINQYRQNEMFKTAFFLSEEDQYKPHDKVDELLNEEEAQFEPINESITNVNHDYSETEEHAEEAFHPSDDLLDTDESMLKFDTEAALPLFEEEEKTHESVFNYSFNEEKNDIPKEDDLNKEISNNDIPEVQQEETQEIDKEVLISEHHEDLNPHLKEQPHHSEEENTHFSPEN
ncbi:MAG: hypothetical protein Q8K60_04930 [Parachlamydiaceae bacterium]|nr:hypothetical protein [Parachlamydiaceae bacterium]